MNNHVLVNISVSFITV